MTYSIQYGLAVGVSLASVAVGVILNTPAANLGISPIVAEWFKVILPVLSVLAGILPSVRRPPEEARRGKD